MSSPTPTTWAPAPDAPELAHGVVDVWLVDLEGTADGETLSEDERARARAFHFERHRTRFTAARAALRGILSRYTGSPAAELAFAYGPHGKPTLARNDDDVCFNLSHSHTLALVALTRRRQIGVDIERRRANHDVDRTIARFFSEKENQAFRAVARERWRHEFFRCWTRKEAFLKARGHGFFHSTRRFTVSVGPTEPPRLIEIADEPGEASRWSLHDFEPAEDYAGALAVEGAPPTVRTFRFVG